MKKIAILLALLTSFEYAFAQINCTSPINASAQLNGSTLTMQWVDTNTPPATSWDISIYFYNPFGYIPPPNPSPPVTDAGVTSNPYTKTVFSPDSVYCYYIRSNCPNSTTPSSWGGPFCTSPPLSNPNPLEKKDFNFFPNPVNDKLVIEVNKSHQDKLQFELYNVIGRQVLKESIVQQRQVFDVQNITYGIYLGVLRKNGKIIMRNKIRINH